MFSFYVKYTCDGFTKVTNSFSHITFALLQPCNLWQFLQYPWILFFSVTDDSTFIYTIKND